MDCPDQCLHSYGHFLVITGYFYGIIHSINGFSSVLMTGILGHICRHNFCLDLSTYNSIEPDPYKLHSLWGIVNGASSSSHILNDTDRGV